MVERDAYQVLEIGRDAPPDEVREAYWRLARRFHPDGTAPDVIRMSEVNAAYERIERERRLTGAPTPAPVATGPGHVEPTPDTPPPAGQPPRGSLLERMRNVENAESSVLAFGQYAGSRIADVAKQDPRYLRWLARQVSGIRYRAEIERVLGETT